MNILKQQLLSDIAAIDAQLAKEDPKVRKAYMELREKKEAQIAQLDAAEHVANPTVVPPAPEPAPAVPSVPNPNEDPFPAISMTEPAAPLAADETL